MRKDSAEAQQAYLDQMVQVIARIQSYTSVSKKEFLADTMRQDAVIRQFEILGEVTNRLAQAVKDARPEIPWHQIVAHRNRLIHGYLDVNLEVVWATAKKDLPALASAVSVLRRRKRWSADRNTLIS